MGINSRYVSPSPYLLSKCNIDPSILQLKADHIGPLSEFNVNKVTQNRVAFPFPSRPLTPLWPRRISAYLPSPQGPLPRKRGISELSLLLYPWGGPYIKIETFWWKDDRASRSHLTYLSVRDELYNRTLIMLYPYYRCGTLWAKRSYLDSARRL